MAYIYFNDGTLTSLLPLFYDAAAPVKSRFANWTPMAQDVGDRATALGTGRIAASFTYRTDYIVSFEMPNISTNGPSGVNMVTVAQRLMRHASNGGSFSVAIQDDDGTADRVAYAAAPMTLTLADPKQMLYTLSVTALSDVAVPWQAIYGGARV